MKQTISGFGVTTVALALVGSLLLSGSVCAEKAELVVQSGHTQPVHAISYSRNGQWLASASEDGTVKIWEVGTGREIRTLHGHGRPVYSVAFSPDGARVAAGSGGIGVGEVDVWDASTGKELRRLAGLPGAVYALAFSPDGTRLAGAGGTLDRGDVRVWDASTGAPEASFEGHRGWIYALVFSPDGAILATGGWDNDIRTWDTRDYHPLHVLEGHADWIQALAFSPDSSWLASGSVDGTVRVWAAVSGKLLRVIHVGTAPVQTVTVSVDGREIASAGGASEVRIWNATPGALAQSFRGDVRAVRALAFRPDGGQLASGGNDSAIHLWTLDGGREASTLTGQAGTILCAAFSQDGRLIAEGGADHCVRLWDLTVGAEISVLQGHQAPIRALAFSKNGARLATGDDQHLIRVWDLSTGRTVQILLGQDYPVRLVAFSPDGRLLASASEKTYERLSIASSTLNVASEVYQVRIWDVASGRCLHTLKGRAGLPSDLFFSKDGRSVAVIGLKLGNGDDRNAYQPDTTPVVLNSWNVSDGKELLASEGDQTFVADEAGGYTLSSGDSRGLRMAPDGARLRLQEEKGNTETELVSLIPLRGKDWAVVTPDGRFDASPGGMEQMHYAVGMETIDLTQLKARDWEPGLLAKLTGFSHDPLRSVEALGDVALFPRVQNSSIDGTNNKLSLDLVNRGGGIGRVQIFVNGKELTQDARGPSVNPEAAAAHVVVDLAGAPFLPGQPNQIRIVAWNKEGYLSARGVELAWRPPAAALPHPELWAIVAGISRYSSEGLRLRFSARDAASMAQALCLGSRRLFGATRTHLILLTDDDLASAPARRPGLQGSTDGALELPPTKDGLRQAFEIVRRAKPGDILVVYLAGHGVALPGDLYCYLTKDATTGDPGTLLHDHTLRMATTLSSEELAEWMKASPALKQVMVLDTCAAGAAAAKLIEKREISSDQVRAIDRLQNRTGLHVLMGCAADAVSYEASQFNEGLLTYSLLEGMRGAALREGQYADVSPLFQYAADRVQQLARNIGGVQRPTLAEPDGPSFDIGEFDGADQAAIPLANPRPLVLRPVLLDPDDVGDPLLLQPLLASRLRQENDNDVGGGSTAFVDAEEMPGAVLPKGLYRVQGEVVRVTLVLWKDNRTLRSLQISGSARNLPALVEQIAGAIRAALAQGTPAPGRTSLASVGSTVTPHPRPSVQP